MNVGRGHLGSVARAAARGRGWNQRAFVAAGALLSGLALPASGIADHAAGGPAESAVGWSIVHVALGALFAVFCVWHVVLNRVALLRYLRARMPARVLPTREVLAALALVGVVLALTVTHALVGP